MVLNEMEKPTEPGLVQTGVYLTPAQKRRLRLTAAEQDSNTSSIVREAIDEWFDKHLD